jgi:hypothetical protein
VDCSSGEAVLAGEGGSGGAVAGVGLRQDIAHMRPDGMLTEEEGDGDLS